MPVDKAKAFAQNREFIGKAVEATLKGDLDTLKSLLGPKPQNTIRETKEGNGKGLIHFAAQKSRIEVLEWLVSNGAQISQTDDLGNNVACLAAYSEELPMIEHLKSNYPESIFHRNNKGMSILHIAVESGFMPIIEFCIQEGFDIQEESQNGTPLELALIWKRTELLEMLLRQGADPNGSKGKYFPPPLVIASSMGYTQAIELLLQHKADLELTGTDFVTPLEVAAESNLNDTLLKLLGSGARVTGRVVKAAFREKHYEVIDLLLKVPPTNPAPVKETSEEETERAEAVKAQGNSAFSKKDYRESIELYTQAIEIVPKSIYYSNRSQGYFFTGNYKEASEDANIARAIDPNNTKASFREAQARFSLGEFQEAVALYWNALKFDFNNSGVKSAFIKSLDSLV